MGGLRSDGLGWRLMADRPLVCCLAVGGVCPQRYLFPYRDSEDEWSQLATAGGVCRGVAFPYIGMVGPGGLELATAGGVCPRRYLFPYRDKCF